MNLNPLNYTKKINWEERYLPPNLYGKSLNEEWKELDEKYFPTQSFDLYWWLFIHRNEIESI